MDADIVRTDQASFEAKHDDIEQHIEKGDKEQLMRVRQSYYPLKKEKNVLLFFILEFHSNHRSKYFT